MRKIYYAGIGSRETPEDILAIMSDLAFKLANKGYILRSGGADGADSAFEKGCDLAKGKKEIFIPWDRFNGRERGNGVVSLSQLDATIVSQAMKMASEYHPNWKICSSGGRLLHSRNCFQVLGLSLESPSSFIVCWTRNASGAGGTGQAIRVAEANNIQIFDLADIHDLARIKRFVGG